MLVEKLLKLLSVLPIFPERKSYGVNKQGGHAGRKFVVTWKNILNRKYVMDVRYVDEYDGEFD